jgi:hypothetical protein
MWLKPENRCLVPANSFAKYAPEPNPETKKKDVVWFALNEHRPLFAFAGIWTAFNGGRIKAAANGCRVHPDRTRRGREGSDHDVMSGWADTVNSNVAPRGTFALAHRRPPCASMIDRQIDRPIPKPPDFVV